MNRVYRAIVWVCIVAHLNLVIPPFHVAQAMNPDDDLGMVSKVTATTTLNNPNLEALLEEDLPFNPRGLTSNAADIWEEISSLTSPFWKIGVPLILLASFLEDANPLYYCFAYVIGFMLSDTLDLPSLTKQTLKGAQTTCRSIVSSELDWATKAFLALSLFFSRVGAIPTINGGQVLKISRDDFAVARYNHTTAPFLVELDPNQKYSIYLNTSFYENEISDENYHSLRRNNILYIVKSIMNSNNNITLIKDLGENGVSFSSTAKNLEAFLTNLSFMTLPTINFWQTFYFCNNTEAIEPFINATRYFSGLPPPIPAPIPNALPSPLTYIFGSFGSAGAIIIGVFFGYDLPAKLKDFLYPEPTDESIALNLIEILSSNNENGLDYDTVSRELEKIEDLEMRQNLAWDIILKYKESLNNPLFHLCNYIEKKYPAYDEAVEIQVDFLHKILSTYSIDSVFKTIFFQKLSPVDDTVRRQEISWQYIQKYKDSIKLKGPRVLFEMYGLIEDCEENASKDERGIASHVEPLKEILLHDPEIEAPLPGYQDSENKTPKNAIKPTRYEEALSLQAECLLDILDQDLDAQASIRLYQIKLNHELENMNDKRRQDMITRLITHSNLSLNLRENLCDQIQKDHPQHNRVLIEKAHLIHTNTELSTDERFTQTMLVLIGLPADEDAKAFRHTLREDYWSFEVGGLMPKALNDPQNEQQLTDFISYAQEQKEMKKKLNAMTSL